MEAKTYDFRAGTETVTVTKTDSITRYISASRQGGAWVPTAGELEKVVACLITVIRAWTGDLARENRAAWVLR